MSTSHSSIDLVLDRFPEVNETNEVEECLRPRKLCMCWRRILAKDQQNLCDYRKLYFLELTYGTLFQGSTTSSMSSVKLGLIVITGGGGFSAKFRVGGAAHSLKM